MSIGSNKKYFRRELMPYFENFFNPTLNADLKA